MRPHINWQGLRICSLTTRKHIAHLIKAHRAASNLAPIEKQLTAFAVFIRQSLAVIAACHTRPNLGHLHQTVPKTFAVNLQIFANSSHETVLHFRIITVAQLII